MTIDDTAEPIAPRRATAGDELTERVRAVRERNAVAQQGRWKQETNKWMRWTHVYVSMFALLITLFFGITGLTLNHPAWTFGDDVRQDTFAGTLPSTVIADGRLEFLLVSDYLRAEHGIAADVTGFDMSGDEGSLSYAGPGYGAEAFFDATSLDYSVTVQQEGFVAVMNDLHKGRDTNAAWSWVIDFSAGFLVLVAVTGLAIQFLMRKRRTRAFILAGVGSVVSIFFAWSTLA